ncbi:uncharacterized protein SAPINGB_P003303 [Magnusiomyces paraingens]|uniref:Mitochondrial outer membrane protein porin n=1 Tax=Magnusiomyces paraingens TaxID=2606893 RepID=A0A5E8BK39_9ASCO|nr:uncharacterized protein SAPINGB_P003303 [Saprochaete ingens]VVT52058.1 unnamed protein product [Saprochaete ingens]
MSVPAFSDIGKAPNDLLSRDYFHLAPAAIEVKSKAPNGVAFTVKGKANQANTAISGSLEGKFSDKPTGLTLTQGWSTANVLDTKIELSNAIAPGFKAELLTSYAPAKNTTSAKVNFHFSQPNFYGRAFFDLLKGPIFTGDVAFGQSGFLVGSEFGYDISSGAVTKYSVALGYGAPSYTAAITATSNLSVFSGSYYHKISPLTEVGAKAVYDSANAAKGVALEVGTKHQLDSSAFVKAKINSASIASLAYSQVLRPGVKLGLGVSFDTQKLNESAHKLGLSLTVEA